MNKRNLSFLFSVILLPLIAYALHARTATLKGVETQIVQTAIEQIQALPSEMSTSTQASSTSTNAQIVRVVDGDTLDVRIDGQTTDQKIRLLGINTPEVVDPRKPVECFGKEASAYMHKLVDGKRVRLEGDPQADERDKYQRLLRNVFLADGTDVNALMVKEGHAYAYLSFPLSPSRKAELKRLQLDAQTAKVGLWSTGSCNGKK
ncbi:thermonuclease family protein [Patescibacteria group bacterium]|nr:thermonuclease family protein [Patescibacteria group bacterium]